MCNFVFLCATSYGELKIVNKNKNNNNHHQYKFQ